MVSLALDTKSGPRRELWHGHGQHPMCWHWEQNQAREKSPDRAMANVSATTIGYQGTGMGPI